MERVSMGTTITRRAKWQYPPAQPSPRIIHLPRRPRRKAPKASPSELPGKERKGMVLESLFYRGGSFTSGSVPVVLVSPRESDDEMRRGRVAEEEERENRSCSVAFVEEEKWRFQAEMLRAECNLLRMERKIAVKKMERRRVHMERTLKSAAQILLSVGFFFSLPFLFGSRENISFLTLVLAFGLQGRKNICEGKNVNMALLDEQINELVEKIENLQKRSGVKNIEVKIFSNFDKKLSSLQKQLEKSGFKRISDEEQCVKEIRQMAEASMSIKTISEDDDHNRNVRNYSDLQVENLRTKMDGLSKGFLLEEYSDLSSSSLQQSCKEKMPHEARVCSGHCKAIVQRVVDQIRAETEQWSQMQGMLVLVRDEMEELHASRDFWEDRALDLDYRIRSLQSAVKEWRQRALSSEAEANESQAQVYVLRQEVERFRQERERKTARTRVASPINREAQSETEKARSEVALEDQNVEIVKKSNLQARSSHLATLTSCPSSIGLSLRTLRFNINAHCDVIEAHRDANIHELNVHLAQLVEMLEVEKRNGEHSMNSFSLAALKHGRREDPTPIPGGDRTKHGGTSSWTHVYLNSSSLGLKRTSPPYNINSDATKLPVYRKLANPIEAQIFRSVLDSFNLGDNQGVRWYVMVDDDTVFFLENLVETLAKYDHTKHYYIGMCSESAISNFLFAYDMAYGGSGYALSYSLVQQLAPLMNDCLERYPFSHTSNHLASSCLFDLGISPTIEPGVHLCRLIFWVTYRQHNPNLPQQEQNQRGQTPHASSQSGSITASTANLMLQQAQEPVHLHLLGLLGSHIRIHHPSERSEETPRDIQALEKGSAPIVHVQHQAGHKGSVPSSTCALHGTRQEIERGFVGPLDV
ncbi:Myosin-related isoform 2 [Hibiscus syriacus]|uniref:Myosin-related isoform 2 n=1 Tax=Hibiscus syriacus TaxID=106335 RepID=A0A6A3D832_HIBSY|nr:Myosin-related isoform 2 [Hibiscus syriacus]